MGTKPYDTTYAVRYIARALEHLTTPDWGDILARDPERNRIDHLQTAADQLHYAESNIRAELARLRAIRFPPKPKAAA